jgi:hypothetical protein
MHELVDLGHSMARVVVGLCHDETRMSEQIGISPAEEGWTVASHNEMYLVAALTCNALQQRVVSISVPCTAQSKLELSNTMLVYERASTSRWFEP